MSARGTSPLYSNSCQRLLLERYAQTNGFENTLFLADDGYSGTNFERPSWKKVIELIEADKVETLIVKDFGGFSLAFINGSSASSQPSYLKSQRRHCQGRGRITIVVQCIFCLQAIGAHFFKRLGNGSKFF